MEKLRVYEFRVSGEKEWYCARSKEEAIKEFESISCGLLDENDEVEEVPEEKWGEMKVVDFDTTINGEHPVLYTFKEYMSTATSPDVIATTVY